MMFSKTECMPTLMERPESIQNNSNLDILHWTLWDIFNGVAPSDKLQQPSYNAA